MTTFILASLALTIAILAFAHSIRMARWLDRVERSRFVRPSDGNAWWI